MDLDPQLKDLTIGAEALIFPNHVVPQRTPTPFPSQMHSDDSPNDCQNHNHQTHRNGNQSNNSGRLEDCAEYRQRIPRKPLKRPKRFYHLPTPSHDHSAPAVLLQQHAELLESINYDGFMDTSTSTRYGRWDTTLSIHNSANNSRESHNSKNSISSRNSGGSVKERNLTQRRSKEDKGAERKKGRKSELKNVKDKTEGNSEMDVKNATVHNNSGDLNVPLQGGKIEG